MAVEPTKAWTSRHARTRRTKTVYYDVLQRSAGADLGGTKVVATPGTGKSIFGRYGSLESTTRCRRIEPSKRRADVKAWLLLLVLSGSTLSWRGAESLCRA
jgi:hypothetical protein